MITTHEANEAGQIACRTHLVAAGRPDLTPTAGSSTCEHQACRKIRERVRLSRLSRRGASWLDAWPTPFTPAQEYAAGAYAGLRTSICPGGDGHEGRGASAEYCDACIADAIAVAYEAWQGE